MDLFNLSNKVAIVTGGNRGIGFGIAKALASAGADVVIANRRTVEGQVAAESINNEGFKAIAVPVDVSSIPSIYDMTAKVIKDFGKIDILVNCAGLVIRKPAEEFPEEDWDRLMNVNLKGVFYCCQAVGQEMIKKKKGKIINISSNISARVQVNRTAYATSKAGLNHMTRSLAYEWARHGINVNVMAPTVTITDMNRNYFTKEHPEELQKYAEQTPMGRVAELDDYTGTAVYLASDASNFVTGEVIFVSGGITL